MGLVSTVDTGSKDKRGKALPVDLIQIGCGTVGTELLRQLAMQKMYLLDRGVELRVVAITNSRRMIIGDDGLELADWQQLLRAGDPLDIGELVGLGARLANPVLVDCTASNAVPASYPRFLKAGCNIVTPNKRGNTGSMEQYQALRSLAQSRRRRYLYEATVGAGLPVIDTLKHLLMAGDELISCSGILSGSLSFLFGRLEKGATFSRAVGEAVAGGFTEPDPRDDLAGIDVARKVLILAREAGYPMELTDIECTGLLPQNYMTMGKDEFLDRLPELDAEWAARVSAAAAEGKVLRFAGSIESGKGRAGLLAVGPEHPLFAVSGGENALAFNTRYYSPGPLVLRGYGAGARVTAAGIVGDIMRTVNWNRED